MEMTTLLLVWGFLLLTTVVFFIASEIIEDNLDENHPVKKWWRKHLVDKAPDDMDI